MGWGEYLSISSVLGGLVVIDRGCLLRLSVVSMKLFDKLLFKLYITAVTCEMSNFLVLIILIVFFSEKSFHLRRCVATFLFLVYDFHFLLHTCKNVFFFRFP